MDLELTRSGHVLTYKIDLLKNKGYVFGDFQISPKIEVDHSPSSGRVTGLSLSVLDTLASIFRFLHFWSFEIPGRFQEISSKM